MLLEQGPLVLQLQSFACISGNAFRNDFRILPLLLAYGEQIAMPPIGPLVIMYTGYRQEANDTRFIPTIGNACVRLADITIDVLINGANAPAGYEFDHVLLTLFFSKCAHAVSLRRKKDDNDNYYVILDSARGIFQLPYLHLGQKLLHGILSLYGKSLETPVDFVGVEYTVFVRKDAYPPPAT